ncbi:hypothetical protein AX16_006421 [Volvariella volvacea WC 439]|nr:hypothetical protein AX16_006421 [Volvariella volvacea WC 439]
MNASASTRDIRPGFGTWTTGRMSSKLEEAAAITWAEAALDFNYSFNAAQVSPDGPSPSSSGLPAQYIVPLPVNLSPLTSARWLMDVFVLQPSCDWYTTNITGTVRIEDLFSNTTSLPQTTVNIPDLGIWFNISSPTDSDALDRGFYMSHVPFGVYQAFNSTAGNAALGGYSIWKISQHFQNTTTDEALEFTKELMFNATGVPTFGVIDQHGGTFQYAFLACSPGASIETVEVANRGRDLAITSTGATETFTRQKIWIGFRATSSFRRCSLILNEALTQVCLRIRRVHEPKQALSLAGT